MEELSRNKQQYIIMTVIYDELVDFTMGNGETFRDASILMAELCECEVNEIPPYVMTSVNETLKHYGEIISILEPHLVDWKWNRLPLLTQAILLMSYAHYKYVEDIKKNIVINIAVELAKKYLGDKKDVSFINAILDKVL